MIPANCSIEVTGRGHRWTVWATNTYAGGTHVSTWHRFSKKRALRKAERLVAALGEVTPDELIVLRRVDR